MHLFSEVIFEYVYRISRDLPYDSLCLLGGSSGDKGIIIYIVQIIITMPYIFVPVSIVSLDLLFVWFDLI